MKKLSLAGISVALASCSSIEQPYLINGNYYFVSPKMCNTVQQTSPNTITCYNKKGKAFPQRALTSYELASYGAQIQEMNASIAANNAALQAQTQAYAASNSNNASPTVTPITTGTGNSYAYCSTYGNQFSCRSPLPEANFSCTKAGSMFICKPR